MPHRDRTTPSKGVSLAKGPIGLIGLIGVIYGVSALVFSSHDFALHIPHGAVHGKRWIGLEVNGWTELLFIAAGLALLFSAPLHWGAKSMSLLVGWVMIAAAIIALIRGDGVFGIFAANHLTELVWAAAGVLLLLLALLPRVGRRRGEEVRDQPVDRRPRGSVQREPQGGMRERRQRVAAGAPDAEHGGLVTDDMQEPPSTAGARRTDNDQSR